MTLRLNTPLVRTLGFIAAGLVVLYFLVGGQINSALTTACQVGKATYQSISTDISLQTQAYQINVQQGQTAKAALNLSTANSLRIDLAQLPRCAAP